MMNAEEDVSIMIDQDESRDESRDNKIQNSKEIPIKQSLRCLHINFICFLIVWFSVLIVMHLI